MLNVKFIEGLYSGSKEIAHERGVEVSTVRTHISNMMKGLGLSSASELAVFAAENHLLDMDSVPAGMTKNLTQQQNIVLGGHYNSTYKLAANQLGISISTIRTHWHNIYKTTGAKTKVQAVLMAYKDSLITSPQTNY